MRQRRPALATNVIMPDWGMAPETSRLARWLKAEGDGVVQGEPLVEIETGKVTVEVEAPASGTLASIAAAEGAEVALGQTLALILADGEAAPSEPPVSAAPRPAPAAPAGEQAAVGNVWRVMAERLTTSWAEVPHFYLVRDVNTSALRAWRQERRRSGGGVPSISDVLVRLCAVALVEHPRMNASWSEGAITLHPSVNIGLAVAIDDGLIVPVIHGVERMSMEEITARRTELVERARAGKLRPEDVAGGTFSITNLGMFGVDAFDAIVNPPQAAILAVGRIADRVVAVKGEPSVQPMMTLTLSVDHRAADGARAAPFLDALASLIEGGTALDP